MSDIRRQLNIEVEAKTHFLTTLAARHRGMTLASFAESLIVKGITESAMREAEPSVFEPQGENRKFKLWRDELWSEDYAVRLFNLACADETLLSPAELKLFAKLAARVAARAQPLNAGTFSACFHEAKVSE